MVLPSTRGWNSSTRSIRKSVLVRIGFIDEPVYESRKLSNEFRKEELFRMGLIG